MASRSSETPRSQNVLGKYNQQVNDSDAQEEGPDDVDIESVSEGNIDDRCVICLQAIVDRTILPGCAHDRFCFECIEMWTGQSRKCPLCTAAIGGYLIHNIRSENDFLKYYLAPLRTSPPPTLPLTEVLRQRPPPRRAPQVVWGRPKQETRDEFDRALDKRRWIYRHNLYAKHVASNSHTRFKPYPTPLQFAASPDLISRTTIFLRRELLVWSNLDVEFLTTFILALMKSIDIRSESAVKLLAEFLDAETPYTPSGRKENAEHFAHELYTYLRSPYRDLSVYDSVIQYDRPSSASPPPVRRRHDRWAERRQGPRSAQDSLARDSGPSGRRRSQLFARQGDSSEDEAIERSPRESWSPAYQRRRSYSPRPEHSFEEQSCFRLGASGTGQIGYRNSGRTGTSQARRAGKSSARYAGDTSMSPDLERSNVDQTRGDPSRSSAKVEKQTVSELSSMYDDVDGSEYGVELPTGSPSPKDLSLVPMFQPRTPQSLERSGTGTDPAGDTIATRTKGFSIKGISRKVPSLGTASRGLTIRGRATEYHGGSRVLAEDPFKAENNIDASVLPPVENGLSTPGAAEDVGAMRDSLAVPTSLRKGKEKAAQSEARIKANGQRLGATNSRSETITDRSTRERLLRKLMTERAKFGATEETMDANEYLDIRIPGKDTGDTIHLDTVDPLLVEKEARLKVKARHRLQPGS